MRYGRDSLRHAYDYTPRPRRLRMYNGVRPRERGKGGVCFHHPKHARLHTPYPEIHPL